jgi:putative nucleotidyltransferase with HDIG domain
MTAHYVHQEPPGLDRKAFRCDSQHRRPGSAGSQTRRPSRHTVLVIADEVDVRRSLHDLLRLQYRTKAAPQSDVGLEIMSPQPVHILLAGPGITPMTGIEFLSHISAEHAEAVRLLLTARANIKAVIDAVNSGQVYRYISKRLDGADVQGTRYQAAENHQLRTHGKQWTYNEERKTATAKMVQAYDMTLEGWSRALELRDQETDGHSRGISELAVRLAQAMGMEGVQLLHVRRGALLHDIGKVVIPNRILIKPGPLTVEEWDIMKRHASYGYELLAPIAFLQEALDIPYCHHERWDGSGYPRGLKGKEIPLAARVFAVIDVWDALASDRPYRKAWPEQAARAYIHSLSGAHFDPQVVETFLRVVV